jgi:hypothetical protein
MPNAAAVSGLIVSFVTVPTSRDEVLTFTEDSCPIKALDRALLKAQSRMRCAGGIEEYCTSKQIHLGWVSCFNAFKGVRRPPVERCTLIIFP